MDSQAAQVFCGKTKERHAGRIEMRSRDFSQVLTQKRALNVFPAKIVLLWSNLSTIDAVVYETNSAEFYRQQNDDWRRETSATPISDIYQILVM